MKKYMSLMILTLLTSTSFGGQALHQSIESGLKALEGNVAPNDIIGVPAAKEALKNLLLKINDELQIGQRNGNKHETLLKVTRNLVDFTNRTEASDIFNQKEVIEISEIDQIADQVRRELMGTYR